jgi:hypothetical protein
LKEKIKQAKKRLKKKSNNQETEYNIWYINKTKSNGNRWKKNLKQRKTNKKKEDYNWIFFLNFFFIKIILFLLF